MQEHEFDDATLQAFLARLQIDDPPPTPLRDALEPLLFALARLVLQGTPGHGSFAILECEDVFVQFAGTPGDTILWVEAVSNHYLPEHRQLSEEAIAQLLTLGFAEPTREPDVSCSTGSPNFHREADVSTETALYEVALLAVSVLRDVYKCCEESEIGLTLHIGVWPASERAA